MRAGLTSLVSPASDGFALDVVRHLRTGGHAVDWIGGPWQERLAALQSGSASVGWLCGLLHVELQQAGKWALQPVAAPICRRTGLPVYFGDVVVRSTADHDDLASLEGSVLAYNEEASLSGYRMLREHLARIGRDPTFFSNAIRTGSHTASMEAIRTGAADCAVIDSTILDGPRAPHRGELRTVLSLGPYPAPPIVVASRDDAVREALCSHPRLAPVTDATYDELRLLGRVPGT